jgi:hypothetical protein
MNNQKWVVKLEVILHAEAINNVGKITRRLPFVSARKPQSIELEIMP